MEKIPITPQMLRTVVKELQKFQLFVKFKKLRDYIQRYYPVETDFQMLDQELQEKLKYAVCVGLLAKRGDDQYYVPSLREEANTDETAINAFWEIYRRNNNQLSNKRKKELSNKRNKDTKSDPSDTKRLTNRKRRDYGNSSKNDETDSSEDLDFFLI